MAVIKVWRNSKGSQPRKAPLRAEAKQRAEEEADSKARMRCHEIYRQTSNKKVSDLTVNEIACRAGV